MSFENLPETWSTLPLTEPGLVADVVDLVVGVADRLDGCLAVLVLDDRRRLVQPCVVGDVGDDADPADAAPFLGQLAEVVAAAGGALVFARGRDGSVLLDDADRRWHDVAVRACREGGATLLGAYLATPAAVRAFPAPLDEDTLASWPGTPRAGP